ncbi:hypothetical protein GUJ93_ZPchr0012g18812 [Zizania palustris]|uniref:TOD1/MUCI70 glycosyltransferase-like domain-containing protein n=1 Tax=Zizania palustris TaxID=103762 RepID=A0A8J5WRK1_ZIZPA|nr:hypothetical protein GUJ93_ZPchr0012g18812 [Zizania palustris]
MKGALLVLAFHLWSCSSSVAFLSALCRKDSKVLNVLDSHQNHALHRCHIPVAHNPNSVAIPKRTLNTIVEKLSYITVDKQDNDLSPLFGGHQSWKQREDGFKLNNTVKVHCGFMKNSGADMDDVDVKYIQKCKFVVASGILDGYDVPHQPSNISLRSQKLFCLLMVVDEASLDFIGKSTTIKFDRAGGKWGLGDLLRPPPVEPIGGVQGHEAVGEEGVAAVGVHPRGGRLGERERVEGGGLARDSAVPDRSRKSDASRASRGGASDGQAEKGRAGRKKVKKSGCPRQRRSRRRSSPRRRSPQRRAKPRLLRV